MILDSEKLLLITKKAIFRNGDLQDFKRKCKILDAKGVPYYKIISGSKAYIIRKDKDYVAYFHADWTNKKLGGICRRASVDANKFLKANNLNYQKAFFPISDYNHKVISESVGDMVKSFDMKACYWNTAKKLGIISEKTYIEGLDAPKDYRLIALGSYSKSTYITEIDKGKTIDRINYKSPKIAVWYRILQEVEKIYNEATDIVGMDNYLMWRTDQIICNEKMTSELTKYFRSENIATTKDILKVTNYERSTLSGIYLSRPNDNKFDIFVPSNVSLSKV